MNILKSYSRIACLLFFSMQNAFGASLAGDLVSYQIVKSDGSIYRSGSAYTSDSTTEFYPFPEYDFRLDVSSSMISIINGSHADFYLSGTDYFRIYDLDWDNSAITLDGISLSVIGVRGYSPVSATFGPHEVIIYPGIDSYWPKGNSFIYVNLETTPVPLPASAWLLGSGLSGLLFFIRKGIQLRT